MKADPTRVPLRTDTADIWVAWYDALKDNFGKKTANQLFVQAWKKRGSNSVSTNTLRSHLSKNGVEIPTTWGQDIVDKGSGIGDFFGDYFQVGKYVGIGMAVILVGGVGLAVFNLARKPAESIGTTLKYAK